MRNHNCRYTREQAEWDLSRAGPLELRNWWLWGQAKDDYRRWPTASPNKNAPEIFFGSCALSPTFQCRLRQSQMLMITMYNWNKMNFKYVWENSDQYSFILVPYYNNLTCLSLLCFVLFRSFRYQQCKKKSVGLSLSFFLTFDTKVIRPYSWNKKMCVNNIDFTTLQISLKIAVSF